ncbi:MAG: isopropylmalate isomerase, partial [Seleniivibrio sp.]|nr:isopropylmalate isomerase [Seleniivibrio sp.]
IISGDNFGCGSSREHAPQAIKRAGFNAVIAGSYAEIFFGNCTMLGIVCVVADKATRDALMADAEANPSAEMVIDVDSSKVSFNGKEYAVEIKPNARKAFLEGSYDSLAELLNGLSQVKEVEKTLKYSFV